MPWRSLPRTTAFRWTLAIAGGFAAMALVLFGFIYWQTAVLERERIDLLLTRASERFSALPGTTLIPAIDDWLASDIHAVRYAGVFGTDSRHLAGNLLVPPDDLPLDGRAHRSVFVGISRDRDGDDPEVVRAVAWRETDGRLVMLGYDIDELELVQDLVLRALGLGLVPALLLSLIVGTILALRAQRRVASVHEAVGRIVQGRLAERLPLRGSGDDMDRLTMAVNGMLGEIERLVGEIQAVGNNIAHDLRTPLTRVRMRLERGREEAVTQDAFRLCIDRAILSVDQALSVVSAILRIGEIEHGRRRSQFKQIDLSQVARDAFELYEPFAEERGLALQLDLGTPAPVLGDADLLLEAVGNLLDNAFKYAPPDSTVSLSVLHQNGQWLMRVADRGSGIAVADRERVLQRFYQTEKSRTVGGSGLGLSLVDAISRLHGFELRISDAEPGCIVDMLCGSAAASKPDRAV